MKAGRAGLSSFSPLGFHLRGEGVDVRQRTRVARNHYGVLPKFFLRRFQASLRATRHRYTRTAIEQHLRRREPHAARAADYYHLFTLVMFHMYSPRELSVPWLILN